MEPMTLGSPVGSPVTSLGVQSTNPTNAFLPAYLMGDTQSSSSSTTRVAVGGPSPGRTTRQYSTSSSLPSPGSPQPTRDAFFSATRIGNERTTGPPVVSFLTTSVPQQSPATKHSSPFIDHQRILGSPMMPPSYGTPVSQHGSQSFGIIPPGHAYTPGREQSSFLAEQSLLDNSCCDNMEDTWVTVFGFPVASASYIITQFAQLGTIVEQRNLGSGNWMHLKYQTKLQARKALGKNGKIYGGNIMVGVLPYTEKNTQVDKETSICEQSSFFSPLNKSNVTTPKSHIRPLTQAYQTAHAENEVTPNAMTPKKTDGFISRAMQHILGI